MSEFNKHAGLGCLSVKLPQVRLTLAGLDTISFQGALAFILFVPVEDNLEESVLSFHQEGIELAGQQMPSLAEPMPAYFKT